MRIKKEVIHTIEIEKSRFICYMNRVFDEQQAKDYLASIKKLHPNANHHCYGYIINNNLQRSSDNGEPAGTAGVPILQTLQKLGLEDTIAIVVRYFGGIKLGAGGLIRAYTAAVAQTSTLVTFLNIETRNVYSLTFSYDLIGKIEYFLTNSAQITDKQYNDDVCFSYLCKDNLDEQIMALTNGKYLPKLIEIIEVEVPITTDVN